MIEGIAAIAAVFILFTVMVQSAVLLLSHQAAESIVASSARSAAAGSMVSDRELGEALMRAVPGAWHVEGSVRVVGGIAKGTALVAILPPGPILGGVSFQVDAEVPVVVDP